VLLTLNIRVFDRFYRRSRWMMPQKFSLARMALRLLRRKQIPLLLLPVLPRHLPQQRCCRSALRSRRRARRFWWRLKLGKVAAGSGVGRTATRCTTATTPLTAVPTPSGLFLSTKQAMRCLPKPKHPLRQHLQQQQQQQQPRQQALRLHRRSRLVQQEQQCPSLNSTQRYFLLHLEACVALL